MVPPTYTAIDLETTGLDADSDEIIEIAAITFDQDKVQNEWSSLVNPNRSIPEFITKLTGITQDMVNEAPDLTTLRAQITRILGDEILVGHNVGFDLGFLYANDLALTNRHLDTHVLASILLPEAGRYSLASLAAALDLQSDPDISGHRALIDARRTVDLFRFLKQRARGLEPDILSEVVEAGQQVAWPEVLFFKEALRSVRPREGRRIRRPTRLFREPALSGKALNPVETPEKIDQKAISGMLQHEGELSRSFEGFEHRPQQIRMLEAVIHAFNTGQHLLVEAGTGTGKSLGYLLPAVFWANKNQRRVIVSTNTINLQDQLINKDLPEMQRILPFDIRSAVLKGKRNYLCTRLFQQFRHSGPVNEDEMVVLARLLFWLPQSPVGDVSEINLRTPGERFAWARLNAENDVCTADRCAAEGCPLHFARRRAEQAHILVVNHALLLADIASQNRILPEYLDLVVDEAHHLEAAVTSGLSFQVDKRYLESIFSDIVNPRAGILADLQRRVANALSAESGALIDERVGRLRTNCSKAGLRLDEFFKVLTFFMDMNDGEPGQYAQEIRLITALRHQSEFEDVINSWDNLRQTIQPVHDDLMKLAGDLSEAADEYDIEDSDELWLSLNSMAKRLNDASVQLEALVANPSDGMIYWLRRFRNRLSLHAAPLDVGPLVEEHIFGKLETVILTSATLRTSTPGKEERPSFSYLRDRLHAGHAEELAVGSPFDFENSTLVYLPTDMPEPNQPGYQRHVERAIRDVANALGGRTLALFTSYSQLLKTAEAIEPQLNRANIQVLSQAEGVSRQQLLNQFKARGSRSVLLGTRSFWEGIDVPGEALQAVVIVKFPFDVPTDPIFAARAETYESPFFEYSIPEAVLRFRQGFGRLIRRQDDQGVVIILDKRILTKRYGQAFLNALPTCTILRQRISRVGELSARWTKRDRE